MRRPDPGAVFASDDHRRVLAHMATPDEDNFSEEFTLTRVIQDEFAPNDINEIKEVLDELIEDGYAESVDGEYTMTQLGFDKLTGADTEDEE